MKYALVLALASILAGCSPAHYAVNDDCQNPPAIAPTPAPMSPVTAQEDVASLVTTENTYREGLGQTELSPGLSCVLYTITGGQYINSSSSTGASQSPTITGASQVATFLSNGVFNQPNTSVSAGLNVLPPALQANTRYQNLILLRCTGQIVVQTTDYYNFDLISDDGSVLYIDGARTIDNDGNHGATEKTGQSYLRRGVHTFRLDFAQTGAGSQALILTAAESGSALGLIDPMYFFH